MLVNQVDLCHQLHAPLHPWSWPDRPRSKIYMDYAGPINNQMLFVVVDSFSKWIEVLPVKTASASITTAPYHPSSNVLAEQAIQTCKATINKMSSGTLETNPMFYANY